ncbi:MAG: hypothetical protein WBD45_01535 [Terriglobales bacterium]
MNRSLVLALFACALSAYAQQKSQPAASAAKAVPDLQLYRNKAFGFRYEIPFGWVERTKQMQQGNTDSKGEVLLAVFERPPEATGNTINSAVIIASESAASYPGLKKAEEYLGPLTELTTSKGFQAEGDPSVIEIDTRQLVRADFSKQLGTKRIDDQASQETLTMHQATLILFSHGQIVSFTFIAGSEDELDNLIGSLHFSAAKSPTH